MQAKDVIALVRQRVNDLDAGQYRFQPSELLAYLDAAQREAYRRRPDLFQAEDGGMLPPVTLTTVETYLQLTESWKLPLAQYAAWLALSSESDIADEGKAQAELAGFFAALGVS